MVSRFVDRRTRWEKMRNIVKSNPEALPMMVFVSVACMAGAIFCAHSLYFKPDVWINKKHKTQPTHRMEHDDVRKYIMLGSKPVLQPNAVESDSDEIRKLRQEDIPQLNQSGEAKPPQSRNH